MQLSEAMKLREKWGDKPCDHPHLEKEYHLGSDTGDYACTQCGKADWGSDWNCKTNNSSEKNK
jgi:hypothetical protein